MKGVPFVDYPIMIPSAIFRVNSHLKIRRNAEFLSRNQTLVCAFRHIFRSKEGTPLVELPNHSFVRNKACAKSDFEL